MPPLILSAESLLTQMLAGVMLLHLLAEEHFDNGSRKHTTQQLELHTGEQHRAAKWVRRAEQAS